MIELILATALTCSEAEDLIDSVNRSRVAEKEDVIQVIKINSSPECYERSEHDS